jgi:cytochrome c553
MFRTRINITIGLAVMLLPASVGLAGDSPDDIKQRIGAGDPVAGQVKSLVCQACHGKDGNPITHDCPKLAGQYAAYIQKEIKDFQIGSRRDPIMTDIAARLTNEQDLLDISAYFASQKQMKGARPVITDSGQRRFTVGNGCQTCHGINGKGFAPNNPKTPVIGGQHKEYLIKQLKDFRSAARTNESTGIMGMIAELMTDEEIDDVAGYESGL